MTKKPVSLRRVNNLLEALSRMETVFNFQSSSRKELRKAIQDGLKTKVLGHNVLAKRSRISPSYLSEILSGKQAGPRADGKLIQAGKYLYKTLLKVQAGA